MVHALCRALLLPTVLLVACASPQRALIVDRSTDSYPTPEKVSPGELVLSVKDVDPTRFALVLLSIDTKANASRLEAMLRMALAHLGETRVMNEKEFRQLAADRGFDLSSGALNRSDIGRFSREVAPVLVIDSGFVSPGDGGALFTLHALDGRDSRLLLSVRRERRVQSSYDAEVFFPVLNQLRRWYREAGPRHV